MNRRTILTGGLTAIAAVVSVTPALSAFYWEGLYRGGCNCGSSRSVKKAYKKKSKRRKPSGKMVDDGRVWNKATSPTDYKSSTTSKTMK